MTTGCPVVNRAGSVITFQVEEVNVAIPAALMVCLLFIIALAGVSSLHRLFSSHLFRPFGLQVPNYWNVPAPAAESGQGSS